MNDYLTVKKAFGITVFSLLLSGLFTSGTIVLFQDSDYAVRAGQIGLVLGELILILPAILFLLKKPDIKQRFRLNTVPLSIILMTIVMSVGVTAFTDELDRLMAIILPPPDFLSQLSSSMKAEDTTSLILLFSGSVLFAAIAEELLFRGFLQRTLEKQWKDITKAILVTSLFFAAIHFIPWWVVQIYIIGMILGYLVWRTNSIYPSMIFHGINNGLAFTFANWGEYIDPWYTWKGHVSPIILLGGAALAYVGFKHIMTGK